MQVSFPFTVIKSAGGPYDDEAFTAGYALGVLSHTLADDLVDEPFIMPVYKNSVEQADLIAMKHGWVTIPKGGMGDWVLLQFRKERLAMIAVTEDE